MAQLSPAGKGHRSRPLPEIAAMLAKDKKRIFLLGGTGKVAWEAAAKLKKEYPNLVIAGVDEPHIHIKGEWLENTFEQDELLVENINSAKPDILFLQLGNPKQELLFDRIRSQLKVPVTIGIGGSFERYTGKIPRAPNWMQKTGMEWLQRLIMEPGRLWKRYVIDFLKLIYFGTPLLIFHHVNKLFAPENSYRPLHNSLFLAPEKTITIIPLPKCFDKNTVAEVETLVQEAFDFDVIIFDFRSVKHIDAAASALLIKVWMAAQKKEKEIFALKIPWNIRTLLRLNHAWGYLSDRACNSAREIVSRLKDRDPLPELFESIIQIPPFLFLSFFGELDNSQNYAELSEALQHLMINKVLVVDLTYCVSVESLGWSFLMTLTKGKDNLALIGLNSTLRRQLKQVELDPYFRIFDTKDEFLATQ